MEKSSVEEEKGMTCGFRHVVTFLTFFGAVCFYTVKVSFSVALVAMVNSSQQSTFKDEYRNNYCAEENSPSSQNYSTPSTKATVVIVNNAESRFGERFDWDYKTQSSLLAALFYGCAVSQLLGAVLTQRFGIRWVFGISVLVSSVLSLVTPLAARWDALAVIIIRAVQGISQGSLYPARSQAVSYWVPVMERSRAFSFVLMGNQIGIIAGMFISGILSDSATLGGWSSVFYVFGVFGCVWSVLWIALVTDSPQEHRCVSSREVLLIQGKQQSIQSKSATVPWGSIIKSMPVWSCTLAFIGESVATFTLIAKLPMYLNTVLGFSITSSGVLSAAPFLLRIVGIIASGYVSDAMRQSPRFSITSIRKIMTLIGYVGSGLCFWAIGFAGCQKVLIIVLLCMSKIMLGMSSSGCFVATLDMSPSFSAVLTGIGTTVAFLCSAPMPYVAAFLTRSGHTQGNWGMVFIVVAVVLILTGLQFVILGSAERQPWDLPQPSNVDGFVNLAIVIGEPKEEMTKF